MALSRIAISTQRINGNNTVYWALFETYVLQELDLSEIIYNSRLPYVTIGFEIRSYGLNYGMSKKMVAIELIN